MELNLVNDGIFPIKFDENGLPIDKKLDTGINYPGSIQGEGKLVGVPSLFLRTSGCNLRCAWFSEHGNNQVCDTPYSSYKPEKNMIPVETAAKIVLNNMNRPDFQLRHLVVTGGEPMLYADALGELFIILKEELPDIHITFETNGTLFHDAILPYVDLMSISPKLRTSAPTESTLEGTGIEYSEKSFLRHEKFRKNLSVIQALIDSCFDEDEIPKRENRQRDFQLKFVVSDVLDVLEIENEYIPLLRGVKNSDVYLMPLGLDPETLAISSKLTFEEVLKRDWRFSPRLQVDLFGTKRSV